VLTRTTEGLRSTATQPGIKGSIEDWVMEGHRQARTVAYGDLGSQNPAVIDSDYERQAEPVTETQLERAGVRWLLS
jgi:hypothetical protein